MFSPRSFPIWLVLLSVLLQGRPLSALTADDLWNSYVANPDNHRHIPNNSFAGYMRGEFPVPDLPVVANVVDFGAQAVPGFDNTAAFQAALDYAGELGGGAVLAPAGRYEFQSIIMIRHSGVVLRGMGTEEKEGTSNATILDFKRNLEDILSYRNTGFTPWSWTGGHIWISPDADLFIHRHRGLNTFDFLPWDTWRFDHSVGGNYNGSDPHPWEYWRRSKKLAEIVGEYPRGARTLTLTDTSGIQPGQMIMLHWRLDSDFTLPKELADYPAWSIQNWSQAGSGDWLRPNLYNRYQWPVEVASVSGNTITLRQPLRVAIKDGSSDGIDWRCEVFAMGAHLRNVGVEHLTVRGYNTIEYIDGAPYSGNFNFSQNGSFSSTGWSFQNATVADAGPGRDGGRIAELTQTAANGSMTYTLGNLSSWTHIYITGRARLGTATSYSILVDGVTSHLNLVNTANLSNTEWVDFAIYAKNNNTPTMEITLRITGGSGDNGKTLLLDDMVVYPAIEEWREQFSGGFTAVHLNRVVNGWVRNLETIDNHVSVVSSAAKHLTLSDITIRNETNRAVHNLINSRVESADNLIENIRFLVPAAAHGGMRGHMGLLTEWFTSGNVHKNSYMEHGCFDYHRAVPFDVIHTNQVLIRNTAEQGGNEKAGPALGRRAVHWNMDVDFGAWVNMPKLMPNGALVGVRGPINHGFNNARGVTDGEKGVLIVEPNTTPAITDLHEAQLSHRLLSESASAEITWPAHGATLARGEPVSIRVRGADFSGSGISSLKLFANGSEIAATSGGGSAEIHFDWADAPYGAHSLHAEITVNGETRVSNRVQFTYGIERVRINNTDPRIRFSDMTVYDLSDKPLQGGLVYQPGDAFLDSVHKSTDYFRPRGQFEITFTGVQLDIYAADVFEGGTSSQFPVCEVYVNDMTTPVAVFEVPIRHMFQRMVFTTGLLPHGEHTVRFRVVSNRPVGSDPRPYPHLREARGHFYLDYVEVHELGPEGESAPVIVSQPFPVTATEGQSASFAVVASGYPVPTYQWQRDNHDGSGWFDLAGATDATYQTGALTLADNGASFRVQVSNSEGTVVSDPATLTVLGGSGQPFLYALAGGTFDEASGQFTRSGDDHFQGLVGSFPALALDEVGDYVRIDFTWTGGGANNAAQQVLFGFFSGDPVTANAETDVTNGWEGYFHALGTRNSDGSVNFGVYRQGLGSQPLLSRSTGLAGGTSVDGNGGVINAGHRAGLNQSFGAGAASLTLTRISATEVRLTSTFVTPRSDGGSGGSTNGIGWHNSSTGGVGTLTSTYILANGGPAVLNGLALAAARDFTLSDVVLSTNVQAPGDLPGFDAWMAGYPGVPEDQRDPLDRPGGGQLTNLESYLLGLAPGTGVLADAATLFHEDETTLILQFRVAKGVEGWTLWPQQSGDLQTWQPVGVEAVDLIGEDEDHEHFEVRVPTTPNSSVFLRLAIQAE